MQENWIQNGSDELDFWIFPIIQKILGFFYLCNKTQQLGENTTEGIIKFTLLEQSSQDVKDKTHWKELAPFREANTKFMARAKFSGRFSRVLAKSIAGQVNFGVSTPRKNSPQNFFKLPMPLPETTKEQIYAKKLCSVFWTFYFFEVT